MNDALMSSTRPVLACKQESIRWAFLDGAEPIDPKASWGQRLKLDAEVDGQGAGR